MRSIVRVMFLFVCALGATGCGQNVTANAPVSKADIAAVEVALTSAVRLANVCLAQAVGPCTDPVLRPRLIADIGKAGQAFHQVQADNNAGLSVSLTAVTLAVSLIAADTPVIPSGK